MIQNDKVPSPEGGENGEFLKNKRRRFSPLPPCAARSSLKGSAACTSPDHVQPLFFNGKSFF